MLPQYSLEVHIQKTKKQKNKNCFSKGWVWLTKTKITTILYFTVWINKLLNNSSF